MMSDALHTKIAGIIAGAPDPGVAARNTMYTIALELSRRIEALQREQENLMEQRAIAGFADLIRDHAQACRVHKRDRELVRTALGLDAETPASAPIPQPPSLPTPTAAAAPVSTDPAGPFSWWRRNRRTDQP